MSTRLVILGSAGGPTPKPQRNAASHALVIDGETTVIDCGNGVASQLVRAGIPLSSLKRIFITHHHIDHVADFGLLLHLSWSQLSRRVEVIGPPPIARMMAQYLELYSQDIRYRMADENRRDLREFIQVREIADPGEIVNEERLRVSCTLVEHPPVDRVFAYRFDTPDGSVVFSGDTVPSSSLVALARDADILVHEALYLDNAAGYLPAEKAQAFIARMSRVHTQPEEAGRIAREAGVGRMVLSPLGAIGPIDEAKLKERAGRQFSGEIAIGRDFLEIILPFDSTAEHA